MITDPLRWIDGGDAGERSYLDREKPGGTNPDVERFYLIECATGADECFSDGYYTSRHEAEAAATTLHSGRCATCGGGLRVVVAEAVPEDGEVAELMIRRRNSSPDNERIADIERRLGLPSLPGDRCVDGAQWHSDVEFLLGLVKGHTENTNPDVVGDIGAAERTPAPTPESTRDDSEESTLAPLALSLVVIAAADRIEMLEAELREAQQRADDAYDQLYSTNEAHNDLVAMHNEVSELASAQGEKLMRFTDLAYAANSADLDVRNCRLAIKQLVGTADQERCLDAAGEALKRYRHAVVAILTLAGVVRIPPDLTLCDQ